MVEVDDGRERTGNKVRKLVSIGIQVKQIYSEISLFYSLRHTNSLQRLRIARSSANNLFLSEARVGVKK